MRPKALQHPIVSHSRPPRDADRHSQPVPAMPPGNAVADGESLADWIGTLLLIQPLQIETWDTKLGEAVVLVAYVIAVDEAAGYKVLGEVPIFWQHVKQAVLEATNETQPWTMGVISHGKRAYFLNPPTPKQAVLAGSALASWQAAEAIAAEQSDDEPF